MINKKLVENHIQDLENISLRKNLIILEIKQIGNNKIMIMYENNFIEIYDYNNFNKIFEFESIVKLEKYFLYNNNNLIIIKDLKLDNVFIDDKLNIKIEYNTNIISIILRDIRKINNYDINFFYKN